MFTATFFLPRNFLFHYFDAVLGIDPRILCVLPSVIVRTSFCVLPRRVTCWALALQVLVKGGGVNLLEVAEWKILISLGGMT